MHEAPDRPLEQLARDDARREPDRSPNGALALPALSGELSVDVPEEHVPATRGYWSEAFHHLLRDWQAVLGILLAICVVVATLFAGLLAPYDPMEQLPE